MDDPKAAALVALTGVHVRARAESIRFVKERRQDDLAMFAVEYVDVEDRAGAALTANPLPLHARCRRASAPNL